MEPVLQRLRGEGLSRTQDLTVLMVGGIVGLVIGIALIAQLGF